MGPLNGSYLEAGIPQNGNKTRLEYIAGIWQNGINIRLEDSENEETRRGTPIVTDPPHAN